MPTGVSEFGTIVLQVDDKKIDTFKEYSFGSHFLAPTDAFNFKLGDETTDLKTLDLCKPGKVVKLLIRDKVQCTGYIDKVEITAGRRGTEISIAGRDRLSPVVDSMLHPKTTFSNTTLINVLTKVLGDFGFSQFDISNEKNINKLTGRQQGRKKPKKQLNEFPVQHNSKAHQGEGCFAFLSRVSQRFGLWIWVSCDGDTIICGAPDMDQKPRYSLTHLIGGSGNNIEESHVCWDSTDQPTYLIAKGNIPPTEFERANAVVGLNNPIFSTVPNTPSATFTAKANNAFKTFIAGNPDTTTITVEAPPVQLFNQFASLVARPVWLKDDEARTKDELMKYALREMSLRTRKAFSYTATIMGHELGTPGGQAAPIAVDTVVSVNDDRCNVHGPLYVLGVTHRKSRAGTFTDIEAIWPGTLSF